MDTIELSALHEECEAVEVTLAQVSDEDWRRPGLGEWTLAELTAHLVRSVSRLSDYLERPVDRDAVPLDRVSYYRYDPAEVSPGVAARAREEAAAVDPATLPTLFATAWHRDAELARDLPAERLLQTVSGPVPAGEYLATRVLEVTVHHLDVRRALDLPPVSTPSAARITAALLEGLLGAPAPRALGRARFILVATGRMPSDDERFPVLV